MSLSSTKRTTSKLRIADVHALSSEEVQRVILNRWRAGAITSLLSRVLLFQIARAQGRKRDDRQNSFAPQSAHSGHLSPVSIKGQ